MIVGFVSGGWGVTTGAQGLRGGRAATQKSPNARARSGARAMVMEGDKKGGGMFGGMGQFMDAMNKAKSLASSANDIQEELKKAEIEASSEDGRVRVVVTGQQVPVSVEIADDLLSEGSEKVQAAVLAVMKDAHSKSVAEAQASIRDLTASLGLPTPPSQPPLS